MFLVPISVSLRVPASLGVLFPVLCLDGPPHLAAMSFTHLVKTYELQGDKLLLPKKQLVTYGLYALIAVAVLYLFFDPAPASSKPAVALPLPLPSGANYQQGDVAVSSAPTQQGNKTVY